MTSIRQLCRQRMIKSNILLLQIIICHLYTGNPKQSFFVLFNKCEKVWNMSSIIYLKQYPDFDKK